MGVLPTSVNICAICGSPFSARGSVCSVRSVGISVLPQISRICTDVRVLSRGCTCLRSALPLARARSAPTEQNRYSPTDFTDLHRCYGAFKGVHLSQVHQPSNKCTNRAIGAFCFVGAAETAAPPGLAAWVWQECHTLLICAHPCHLWEALLCKRFCVFGAFRGSFFTACSVGAAETAAPPGGIHRSSV